MGQLIQFPSADNPYTERLEKAADYARETGEIHRLALIARNELVHEAIDHAYPQAAAARAMKMSAPSVTRILAKPPEKTNLPSADAA